MLPKSLLPLLFPLLMSLVMASLMTGIVTAINTGIDASYLQRWGQSFLIAWPLAFIFVLLFAKRVHQLAEAICNREE